MSMMVSFMLSFFPRHVLNGILILLEPVSEGFSTYSFIQILESINWHKVKCWLLGHSKADKSKVNALRTGFKLLLNTMYGRFLELNRCLLKVVDSNFFLRILC